MKISLIILKYTQSNSVCFCKKMDRLSVLVQDGKVMCIEARLGRTEGRQSFLRQCPKVLNLPFEDKQFTAERDNAIDVYNGDEYMDVLADGMWEKKSQRNRKYLQRKRNVHG